jgi:hypothetical protein
MQQSEMEPTKLKKSPTKEKKMPMKRKPTKARTMSGCHLHLYPREHAGN